MTIIRQDANVDVFGIISQWFEFIFVEKRKIVIISQQCMTYAIEMATKLIPCSRVFPRALLHTLTHTNINTTTNTKLLHISYLSRVVDR